MTDIHYLSLAEIGRRIRRREISSEHVTSHLLDRIDATSGAYAAFQQVTPDLALDQARVMDSELEQGRVRGPLHGVPIALKDLIPYRGAPTLAGSPAVEGWNSGESNDPEATVAIKLREAGAVFLGKLKLTEGAHQFHNPELGAPKNPWNPDYWPGASSSGSGVAVAAGLCFGALGTDTGGSIRLPSYMNGVVGLKPTYGRVSSGNVFPLAESLDTIGPMARSVEDVALLFQAIVGSDPLDSSSLDELLPDLAKALERGAAGLRIGIDEGYCAGAGEAVCARISEACSVLSDAGATITPVTMPDQSKVAAAWLVICGVECLAAHKETYPRLADRYGSSFRTVLDIASTFTEAAYQDAVQVREAYTAQLHDVLANLDCLMSPAFHGFHPLASDAEDLAKVAVSGLGEFTAPANFAGVPTLSLPCGYSDDGLPLGFQLLGRRLGEAELVRVGHAIEQGAGWPRRNPPPPAA